MERKNVTVNVQIQLDVFDNGELVDSVTDQLSFVNAVLANLETQPQIFIQNIDLSDITVHENEEDI